MTSAADYSLNRMLVFSAAGHAAVLFFFTVTTYIIGPAEVMMPQAIRVDVVGLPEKNQTLPETPKAQEKPEPATKPKNKLPPKETAPPPAPKAPTIPSKDTKKAMQDAIKKLQREAKAQSAIEKLKEQMAQDKAKEKAAATKAKLIGGNKVSEGNSLEGLESIDFDKYLAELQSRLNANFEIPQWLADGNYTAVVVIHIDQRGYVTKKTMTKSSGNNVFDTIVMGTIDKSSPLPPPPDRLRGRLATTGIPVKFPM